MSFVKCFMARFGGSNVTTFSCMSHFSESNLEVSVLWENPLAPGFTFSGFACLQWQNRDFIVFRAVMRSNLDSSLCWFWCSSHEPQRLQTSQVEGGFSKERSAVLQKCTRMLSACEDFWNWVRMGTFRELCLNFCSEFCRCIESNMHCFRLNRGFEEVEGMAVFWLMLADAEWADLLRAHNWFWRLPSHL